MRMFEKMIPNGHTLGIHFYLKYLFSEADLLDQLAVALQVIVFQIGQQAFSLADKLHQPPIRGKVFFICLKVLGNAINPLRQQSQLRFNGLGICCHGSELCEEFCRVFFSQKSHHIFVKESR